MIAKPSIHPLAAQHLRELRERWGVEPTLEESIWIVELAKRVVDPVPSERRELLGLPVRIGSGDDWLWQPTIGGRVWFRDLATAWWRGDDEQLFRALAFSLANGRDRAVMRSCRTRAEAEAVIWKWSMGLTCNADELQAAVSEVMPESRPETGKKPVKPGTVDWQEVCGELEAATGIPTDHWVWEISMDETERAWIRSRRQAAAMMGVSLADDCSPEDEAVKDLAAAKCAIIAAHREVAP